MIKFTGINEQGEEFLGLGLSQGFCFDEVGVPLHYCNECGVLIAIYNQLCYPCYEKEQDRDEWERLHPEVRCPPRE